MSKPFCANHLCAVNAVVDEESIRLRHMYRRDRKGERPVTLFLYRDARGKELFLCEVCHNAVEMTK